MPFGGESKKNPEPPMAMACHHGYTPQHAIFVLLYLVVVAKLNASRNAALEIRVVGSACSLAAMVYHLVLAAACEVAFSLDDARCVLAYKLARTTPSALWPRYPPVTRLCGFVVHNQGLRPIQGGEAGGGVHACAGKCMRSVVDMQPRE